MKRAVFSLLGALVLPALIAGQAGAAGNAQTLRGTVVNYLSSIGVSGGVVVSHPGTGGIMVNSHNAGIYTNGATVTAQPLGLKANGQVYLLDVSHKHGNVLSALGKDNGKTVTVKGRSVQRNGATLFMVDSVSGR